MVERTTAEDCASDLFARGGKAPLTPNPVSFQFFLQGRYGLKVEVAAEDH